MKLRLAPASSAHVVACLVLAATVGALLAGTASAGPNAGGTLVLHVPDFVIPSDFPEWCPIVEQEVPLDACGNAIVNVDDGSTHLWVVYAAFDPASSPRLSGLTFGVDYDEFVIPVSYESCGDFELSMNDWPEPNTGTAITWDTAQTTHLVQVCVFAGYEYYGSPTTFDLIPHPIGGGVFADDDVPANIDPIAAYGSIGFGGAPGHAPCPGGTPGACCLPDCTCILTFSADECAAAGGSWMGEGTHCDPNPCSCSPLGACCLPDGQCVELPDTHCFELDGVYMGEDTVCTPDPCEPVPVLESSWGTVKEIFR
jgi:hypothetical protein